MKDKIVKVIITLIVLMYCLCILFICKINNIDNYNPIFENSNKELIDTQISKLDSIIIKIK